MIPEQAKCNVRGDETWGWGGTGRNGDIERGDAGVPVY